jgi:hypothetical protein
MGRSRKSSLKKSKNPFLFEKSKDLKEGVKIILYLPKTGVSRESKQQEQR